MLIFSIKEKNLESEIETKDCLEGIRPCFITIKEKNLESEIETTDGYHYWIVPVRRSKRRISSPRLKLQYVRISNAKRQSIKEKNLESEIETTECTHNHL